MNHQCYLYVYRAKVYCARNSIKEIWSDGFKDIVKIDTVDSYRSKENRIIILSLTRSDKQHSPGFLRAPIE